MVAVELFGHLEANLKTIAKMLEGRTIVIHGTKSVANGKMITVSLKPLVINNLNSIGSWSLTIVLLTNFVGYPFSTFSYFSSFE